MSNATPESQQERIVELERKNAILREICSTMSEALEPFAREAEALPWTPGTPMPDVGPPPNFTDFNRARIALEHAKEALS